VSIPTQPQPPEPIGIWQEFALARWLVPVKSEFDPNNHWSGWFDLDANASTGFIEVSGVTFTPDEARALARALMSAADHVELYTHRKLGALNSLIDFGGWPELDNLPNEEQARIRGFVRSAADRIRKSAETPSGDAA
jgi:hypothetical protein